jgi:hypothetical protein
MAFANNINQEYIKIAETPSAGAKDRAGSVVAALVSLQQGDQTGQLEFITDPNSQELKDKMTDDFASESQELSRKAAAAGVEISDIYPSLNVYILLLLGAYYKINPSKLEKKMYINRSIWKPGIDTKIPMAGGTPEEPKIIRAMRVGGEAETHSEEYEYDEESGLYLRGVQRDGEEGQITRGNKLITDFNSENRQELNQDWFDPVAYVVINAIRRERGEQPLGKNTFTRFLGMALAGGWSPVADWSSDRLWFDRSDGVAVPSFGARLSVR